MDYKDAAAAKYNQLADEHPSLMEIMPCGFDCPRAFLRWLGEWDGVVPEFNDEEEENDMNIEEKINEIEREDRRHHMEEYEKRKEAAIKKHKEN